MEKNPEYLSGQMQMTNGSGDRTVEANRRRRAEPPAGGRRRAETPQRRESSGGGMSGGTGSSTGGLGLPSLGGRGPKTIGGLILMLLVLCVFFAFQYFSGSNNQDTGQSD